MASQPTGGNNGAGLRILVAGAGIGGLGAVRALRQRGFAADVVEREPAWTPTGTGINLPGNAARALRVLGLESPVAERAALIPRQRLCDHRGRLLADIDLAALWGDVGPCLALHRAGPARILASHGDSVPVRMGLPVQRLSHHDDSVTVGFGDGTADRYDLVIGADGVHSTVCQLAFGAGAVRPVGQLAWRFVTECPPEVTTWTVLRDATSPSWPCRSAGARSTATATRRPPAPLGCRATMWAGASPSSCPGSPPRVPAILDALGPDHAAHVGPIEEITLDGWSRGSVLLIGDAAHATSPNMAEGAAMALEDGLVPAA